MEEMQKEMLQEMPFQGRAPSGVGLSEGLLNKTPIPPSEVGAFPKQSKPSAPLAV